MLKLSATGITEDIAKTNTESKFLIKHRIYKKPKEEYSLRASFRSRYVFSPDVFLTLKLLLNRSNHCPLSIKKRRSSRTVFDQENNFSKMNLARMRRLIKIKEIIAHRSLEKLTRVFSVNLIVRNCWY